MGYALDLFSPETHTAFGLSDRTISGYMTRVSRWVGILEVTSEPFEDDAPIFVPEDDPFVVRFHVKPLIWLSAEDGVPIKDPTIWSQLDMTRGLDPGASNWTGKVRTSLAPVSKADGTVIERLLRERAENKIHRYELTVDDEKKLKQHVVQRADGPVVVALPDDEEDETPVAPPGDETRESIKIQALLARVGAEMGLRIWIPRNDRAAVTREWKPETGELLDVLPLNYDDVTLQTIERIDVLWLQKRSIVRAFEVEHTTAIYSGILRMADLLALQPNMDMPLAKACTFLDYEDVKELAASRST